MRQRGNILVKTMSHQEGKTIVNIYTPHISVFNFKKQILLTVKAYIGPNTTTVLDLNTLLLPIGHPDKYQQRNSKVKSTS